jgi:hypothetical protein
MLHDERTGSANLKLEPVVYSKRAHLPLKLRAIVAFINAFIHSRTTTCSSELKKCGLRVS